MTVFKNFQLRIILIAFKALNLWDLDLHSFSVTVGLLFSAMIASWGFFSSDCFAAYAFKLSSQKATCRAGCLYRHDFLKRQFSAYLHWKQKPPYFKDFQTFLSRIVSYFNENFEVESTHVNKILKMETRRCNAKLHKTVMFTVKITTCGSS